MGMSQEELVYTFSFDTQPSFSYYPLSEKDNQNYRREGSMNNKPFKIKHYETTSVRT